MYRGGTCDAWCVSVPRIVSGFMLASLATLGPACEPSQELLVDDPSRYIGDVSYRRAVLERDLTAHENDYARDRLALYGLEGEGWELLPEVDPKSRALHEEDLQGVAQGGWPALGEQAASLAPAAAPTSEAEWIALGERVFFDYPLHADPVYEALVRIPGGVDEAGFLRAGQTVVGLRVFEDDHGSVRIGPSCAQCHASYDERGVVTGVLANRAMDIGAARLLVMGLEPGELPEEIDSTAVTDLDKLGPGRTDVLADGEFNPFAIPDFGGLGDMPFLQHNANWQHSGTATLAIRCETLFITSSGEQSRIPRVLSWALATYLRSLPPPPPLDAVPAAEAQRGREVFAAQGCAGCHAPPLYTSSAPISIEVIGTDPAALESPARRTGEVRVPSLRGVGRTAPYLHHGAIPDLEGMFDPERVEPGHRFGLDLGGPDRAALIAFLRSI